MENNKTKEVIVEFVGTTTETVKKKIRFDGRKRDVKVIAIEL